MSSQSTVNRRSDWQQRAEKAHLEILDYPQLIIELQPIIRPLPCQPDNGQYAISRHGYEDGEIRVLMTAGRGPYEYKWYVSDEQGRSLTLITDYEYYEPSRPVGVFDSIPPLKLRGRSAGWYKLVVQDQFNVAEVWVELTQPPLLEAEIRGTNKLGRFGDDDGSLTIDITSGQGPFDYQWFRSDLVAGAYQPFPPATNAFIAGGNIINPTSETVSVNGVLPAGRYRVLVTDCTRAQVTLDWTIQQPPPLDYEVQITEICAPKEKGRIRVAIDNGEGPWLLEVIGLNGVMLSHDSSPISSPPYRYEFISNDLVAGDYQLRITNVNTGLVLASQAVKLLEPADYRLEIIETETIKIHDQPQAQLVAQPVKLDNNAEVVGGWRYQWTGPGVTQDNFTLAVLTNVPAGDYSVTVLPFDQSRYCYNELRAEYRVFQPDPLTVTLAKTDATRFGICDGTITGNVFGGTPPYTLSIGELGLTEIVLEATGSFRFQRLCGLELGRNYEISISDQNGQGPPAPISVTITQPPKLTIQVIAADRIIDWGCDTGRIEVAMVEGTPPISWDWSNGRVTPLIEDLPAGEYCVLATDATGDEQDLCVEVSYRTDHPCANPANYQIRILTPPNVQGQFQEQEFQILTMTWEFDRISQLPTNTCFPNACTKELPYEVHIASSLISFLPPSNLDYELLDPIVNGRGQRIRINDPVEGVVSVQVVLTQSQGTAGRQTIPMIITAGLDNNFDIDNPVVLTYDLDLVVLPADPCRVRSGLKNFQIELTQPNYMVDTSMQVWTWEPDLIPDQSQLEGFWLVDVIMPPDTIFPQCCEPNLNITFQSEPQLPDPRWELLANDYPLPNPVTSTTLRLPWRYTHFSSGNNLDPVSYQLRVSTECAGDDFSPVYIVGPINISPKCSSRKLTGQGRHIRRYHLGGNPGWLVLELDNLQDVNYWEIKYQNEVVATSGNLIRSQGILRWWFAGVGDRIVTVEINNRGGSGLWAYQLNCPGSWGGQYINPAQDTPLQTLSRTSPTIRDFYGSRPVTDSTEYKGGQARWSPLNPISWCPEWFLNTTPNRPCV